MNHTHEGTRLTFGCPACIEQERRAEFLNSLPTLTDQALQDIIHGRQHIHNDWQVVAAQDEIGRRFNTRVDAINEHTRMWADEIRGDA